MVSPLEPTAENLSQEPLISSDSSPVASLPPEILPLIFLDVLRASRAKHSAILTISRVSQHWRAIALSTPELWTWIDTPDMGIIQSFMVRAKNRPLSIAFSEIRSDNHIPITAVLKSLHNIQSLQLSVYYYTDWTRMGPFLEMSGPVPALHSLHLNGFKLPKPLFSGLAPSLRHLHLDSYDTEFKLLPDCPQLRSLCLIRPEDDMLIRVPDFLLRLPTFPLLEKLETDGVFDYGSGAGILPDPIQLPNLRYLRFESEPIHDVIAVLEHLRIATTCKITLDVTEREAGDYLSLFPVMSACRSGPTGFIRKVKIVAAGWVSVKYHEGEKPLRRPRGAFKSTRPGVGFTIWTPRDGNDGSIQMAAEICQNRLDLSRLDAIDLISSGIKDNPTPSPSFWTFIDSLSSLRALKVRQIYGKSFIEYIAAELQSADRALPPFSAIQKLVYEDPLNGADEYSTRLTGLAQYLRVRADKGVALTTLTLVHVKTSPREIPGDVLDDLRGLVQQVKQKVKGIVFDTTSTLVE
ncbi:hypothetical protein BDN72DRAFT_964124 [Pluteus cervinus]|uniref:Uncharacterized protein n=1 Tax=Pluteus cervinus TaxID=181527 RepID=A0ACD3ABX0_9AGAR|nr:hypothetical protein BDN72DRAFT_964124 [Pluteus cervinus]